MAEKKLKNVVTADTSQFKKEMKGAKDTLKDFEKEGNSALSGIAAMFGVDSRAIEGVIGKLGQASNAMKLMGTTGEGASKAVTMGMKALGASIAGLGITAAIAYFKELNEQAAYFEQRLQGVNLAASAKAYRDTYKAALYDASGAGEFWANFKERSKTYFATNLAEIGTFFTTNSGDRAQAAAVAERAGQLASQMVEYKREERDLSIEIQRIDNKIAEAQATFRNTQASVSERKQAEADITDLINQKYDKQIDLQKRITDNIRERNSLATSSEAELDEEANAEKTLLSLEGRRQQEKNALLRTSNSIAGAMKRQAESAREIESALEQIVGKGLAEELNAAIGAEMLKNDVDVQRIFNEGDLAMLKNVPGIQGRAQRMAIDVPIRPVVDTQEAEKAIIQLSEYVEAAALGMSEAIGNLIGDLINGQNAWGNFAQASISVVADMVSMLGQAFIKTGAGVIAAQSAIGTGNGVAAIVAGGAMVAIAAAMKSSMSNAAANWGGGYSTSVASSAYTSGAAGPSTFGREMEVKVTGTLTANGSKLVAVLNNEKNRSDYTT